MFILDVVGLGKKKARLTGLFDYKETIRGTVTRNHVLWDIGTYSNVPSGKMGPNMPPHPESMPTLSNRTLLIACLVGMCEPSK
jgi:hypothetical protein